MFRRAEQSELRQNSSQQSSAPVLPSNEHRHLIQLYHGRRIGVHRRFRPKLKESIFYIETVICKRIYWATGGHAFDDVSPVANTDLKSSRGPISPRKSSEFRCHYLADPIDRLHWRKCSAHGNSFRSRQLVSLSFSWVSGSQEERS